MSEHNRLIDFRLAEPGSLLAGTEDLDGHVLAAPTTAPHLQQQQQQQQQFNSLVDTRPKKMSKKSLRYLAEPSFADDVEQVDLTGDTALHQQRQSRS